MVASGVDVVVEEDGVEDSVIDGVNADDTDVTVLLIKDDWLSWQVSRTTPQVSDSRIPTSYE